MLRHFLILNYRNLVNNKYFTLSTMAGMSITVACSLYILIFLIKETSVDRQIKEDGNIVRVLMKSPVFDEVGISTFDDLPMKLASAFPEVQSATFISTFGVMKVTIHDNIFLEKGILIADSNFFNVFNFKLKEGKSSSCLSVPFTAVITEKLAKIYFGNRDSYLGQELSVDGRNFIVTGVLRELDEESHLNFDMFLSRQSYDLTNSPAMKMGFTYLKLHTGTKIDVLVDKLNQFNGQLLPFEMDKEINFNIEEADKFYFNNTDQIYSYIGNVFHYQDKEILFYSGAIGLSIIALSLINYLIFAQTRLLFKAKQVVLGKIFGKNPFLSFISFSIDSLLIVFLSVFAGMFFIYLFADQVTGLSSIKINFQDFITPKSIAFAVLFVFILALILALINSLILPNIKISDNLSGNYGSSVKSKKMISWIVGIQMTITFTMVIMLVGMLGQVRFIKNYDYGYNTENIIDISLGELPNSMDLEAVQQEFENIVGVENVSVCTGTPISGRWFYNEQINGATLTMSEIYADERYINTVGLLLIKGREFSPAKSDTLGVIVNETAARIFNLKVDSSFNSFNVLGIVKDFNYGMFKESVGPVKITYSTFKNRRHSQEFRLLVRIIDRDVLEVLRDRWSKLFPDIYFNANLLNDEVSSLHRKEFERIELILLMGWVSIGITIFGLMGFSYFLVRVKLREIAIRKVFGANTNEIRLHLFASVFKICAIASILAVIASWYFLKNWLLNYYEKIELTADLFLLPVTLMLIVILLSVALQIFNYSRINPANIIRCE